MAKKVAIITRWPYYRGGHKAGFHHTISHLCNPNQIHSRHNYGPGLALEVYEKYHRTLKFETKHEISMPLYQTKYWAFNSSLSLYCREKRWHRIYLMLWIFFFIVLILFWELVTTEDKYNGIYMDSKFVIIKKHWLQSNLQM